MRVALVHDYLNQYGGAERVLEVLHDLYPQATVFTSLFDPATMPPHFTTWDIRTSFLQRLPGASRHHRALLLLYPLAFESFDLRDYDLVISNSSAWAKAVITAPGTLHLCYCLTPMRWAWQYEQYVEREQLGQATRRVLRGAVHYLRMWDVTTAARVDRFIGISRAVVARIAKFYRRDATVIAPPVDAKRFHVGRGQTDGFLVVSRLVPYKRIDLAVRACTRLGLPLTVIGDGRDRGRLEAMAGSSVTFRGRLDDPAVAEALSSTRAFLFPGEEDFGIAPLEAMASGRPVVAYAAGGALDTVLEGETGAFFSPQTVDALADRLATFDAKRFDPQSLRQHALTFDTEAFVERMGAEVERARAEHAGTRRVARVEPAWV